MRNYILIIFLFFLVSLVEANEKNTLVTDKSLDKIQELYKLDSLAKIEYFHMKSHPKVLTRYDLEQKSENLQSGQYQFVEISYDGRNIGFNSLFVKSLVENSLIYYLHITPEFTYIWSDLSLDIKKIIEELNAISLTPIYIKVNK